MASGRLRQKLCQHLLDEQAFRLVVDFGELPVFKAAATFPAIFVWHKQPRGDTPTTWATVKDFDACYNEGVPQHVARIAQEVPASQFGKGKPRLAAPTNADKYTKMEAAGQRLGLLVRGNICWGIKSGLNEAFVIGRKTRDDLVSEHRHSAEVVKPLLVGDDVRRYEYHFRDTYLIYTPHGIDISRYPAVVRHLRPYRPQLEGRATQQEWYELQQPQEAYVPFLEGAKIVYPEIG